MLADEPVIIATVNSPYQAEGIKTILQAQGISCQLDGDGQAGLSDSHEIVVLVRPIDADQARQLIGQNESNR
jgi:hypothetical protein